MPSLIVHFENGDGEEVLDCGVDVDDVVWDFNSSVLDLNDEYLVGFVAIVPIMNINMS